MHGYLTQALGLDREVAPDVARVACPPGSRLLLCTDGLTNMVEDSGCCRAARPRLGPGRLRRPGRGRSRGRRRRQRDGRRRRVLTAGGAPGRTSWSGPGRAGGDPRVHDLHPLVQRAGRAPALLHPPGGTGGPPRLDLRRRGRPGRRPASRPRPARRSRPARPLSRSQPVSSRRSSGVPSRPSRWYSGTMPSQRRARRIDLGRGHAAATQIGTGCCTGRTMSSSQSLLVMS